ncbi:MAG TPA: hypothetical protein VET23_02820 [Chitinophagaceae bacterium]|nr:hypothetical protein [Chitinophagaceae bacterium]
MSVGAVISYGKVSTSYFSYNTSSLAFTGTLDSWSFMLNFMRYIPANGKITPYLRTAIGVNTWNPNYLYPNGNKFINANDPTALAYQTGIGVKFNLLKSTGMFIEAGYGKYILSGGLSFKS